MKTLRMQLSLIILFSAMLLAGCKHKEKMTTDVDQVPTIEGVKVVSLHPSREIVLPGELKPWNKVTIYSKVKGYIGRVNADRGTVVKKGQVLAVLEAPELVAALNHAKAQVASAEAVLIEQRAKKNSTELTYKRIAETNQTPGAVSANELDLAYARMRADSALETAAKENLIAAQAHYTAQSQFVNYLTVRAPFDGTITERNVSPGELVGPETGAKPLFILEDRSSLRLAVAVPENLSNSIPQKSVVSFSVQADPSKNYTATFARSANSLQENSRTMMIEFDFDNGTGDLKSGMYAEVRLPVERNKSTLFVPRTALIQSTEGVFVIRLNNDVAEWLVIERGASVDSLVEVFGKLNAGDKVARYAFEELRNGQKIAVQ